MKSMLDAIICDVFLDEMFFVCHGSIGHTFSFPAQPAANGNFPNSEY